MPGRAESEKKKMPRALRAEQARIVRAFVDTFTLTWQKRTDEEGNTQAATMERAGLSVQAFMKWKRNAADPTIGNLVSIAYALDRRIDFALHSVSDPHATTSVISQDEGATTVSDDVMNLAEELDRLPDGAKQRIIGHLEGLLAAHRSQRSPSRPDAEQRGHGGRALK